MEEVKNKYKQEYEKSIKQMQKVNPKYQIDIQTEIDKYSKEIKKKLKSFGVKYINYPKVAHEEIVKRALERRKPFKENGSGYRDTLIWVSILDLFKTNKGEIVVFITDNLKDFCCSTEAEKPTLHDDLIKDLIDIGVDEDKVKICQSLKQFNDEIVIPQLSRLHEIEDALLKENYPMLDLVSLIEENQKEIIDIINHDISEVYEIYNFSGTNIAGIPVVNKVSVYFLDDENIFVDIHAELVIEFLDRRTLVYLEQSTIESLYAGKETSWVFQYGEPIKLGIRCTAILNLSLGNVSSFKVESIKSL